MSESLGEKLRQAREAKGLTLSDVAEQAVVDGKRFSKDAWFEYFKGQFAPKQEGPNGLVAVSTTQMTKQQFGDFMQHVEVAAVQTLGVELLEV